MSNNFHHSHNEYDTEELCGEEEEAQHHHEEEEHEEAADGDREELRSSDEEELSPYVDEECEDMEEKYDQINSTEDCCIDHDNTEENDDNDAVDQDDDYTSVDLLSHMHIPLPLSPTLEDLSPLTPTTLVSTTSSMENDASIIIAASAVAASSQASAQYTLLPAKPANYSSKSHQSPLLSSNSSLSSGWLDRESLDWGEIGSNPAATNTSSTPALTSTSPLFSAQTTVGETTVPIYTAEAHNLNTFNNSANNSVPAEALFKSDDITTSITDSATNTPLTGNNISLSSSTTSDSSANSSEEELLDEPDSCWAPAADLSDEGADRVVSESATILWDRSKDEVTATLDLTLIHEHGHEEHHHHVHHQHHHHHIRHQPDQYEDHSENSSDCSAYSETTDSTDSSATEGDASEDMHKELYGSSCCQDHGSQQQECNDDDINKPTSCSDSYISERTQGKGNSNICVINSLVTSLES